MKHKLRIYAMAALVLCVTCVLAVGGTLTQAATDSQQGGEDKLTINVASNESQVKEASAQAQLYRVASAVPDGRYDTYNYEFDVPEFASLKDGFNQQTYTAEDWKELVKRAQKIAEDNNVSPIVTAPVGDTITNLKDGLYLVLIPNASSGKYNFTFEPTLVSMPGKVDSYGNPVYTTDQGTWVKDVTASYEINVKWSMEARKGGLKINKSVNNPNGEPATFTFLIEGETDNGTYQNYAAVQFSGNGNQSTTVNGIPAGYEYTVTEVDSGAGYQTDGANAQKVKVVADQTADVQTAEVNFTNAPSGSGKQGYGIENHFVWDDGESGGDWVLTQIEIKRPNE